MLRRYILHILVSAAALYFISQILNGDFMISGGIPGYIVTAVVLGLLNTLIKPLLKLLSLPLMFMTAGLFSLVLNMAVLFLAQYVLGILAFGEIGIGVTHFAAYFYAGLLIAIANTLTHWLTHK